MIMWFVLMFAPSLAVLFVLPASSSRRTLALCLAFAIPLAGPLLALLAARVRGAGLTELEPKQHEPTRPLKADDIWRVVERPPLLERLLSADPGERLEALVGLSNHADEAAVALLRWTVEHGSPFAVLDAALALEEIELGRERVVAATGRAVREQPTFERALAAADAAAAGVILGIVDAPAVPGLVDQARAHYELAAGLDASRRRDIVGRLARLEVAASRPDRAVELMLAVDDGAGEGDPSRDDVCFAARRFDLLSYVPYAPAAPRAPSAPGEAVAAKVD